MPLWLQFGLRVIVYAVIILVIYNLLKKFILNRFKPNKWMILLVGVAIFFIPSIIIFAAGVTNAKVIQVTQTIQSGLFIIVFLWFMDLSGIGGSSKRNLKSKNDVVIRPKAKPNRVKNMNK